MVPVIPEAETLLEFFHKHRHIAHPLDQPLANVRVDLAPLGHRLARQERWHPLGPIKPLEVFNELGIGERGPLRRPHENMKVIGHHTVGNHLNSTKRGLPPDHPRKFFLTNIIQKTFSANNSGDEVETSGLMD